MMMTGLKELLLAPPPLSLAVAESLTAGNVQARIGAISGASAFFRGGITAYTLAQKTRHLGVDATEAAKSNGVSAAVAAQMARGACALFGSDLALATTGYAECSPVDGVEVPFAYWALAWRESEGRYGVETESILFPAGLERTAVQAAVTEAALAGLMGWLRRRRQPSSGP